MKAILPIFLSVYLIIGIGFGVLAEDSQPEVIKNNKILQVLVSIGFLFLWFPYLLVNMCFTKRDIWFRRKTDD